MKTIFPVTENNLLVIFSNGITYKWVHIISYLKKSIFFLTKEILIFLV